MGASSKIKNTANHNGVGGLNSGLGTGSIQNSSLTKDFKVNASNKLNTANKIKSNKGNQLNREDEKYEA
jgi:hypothetical protein